MAKIMASSCKYKPFAKQRCNRFAGFQPKQPQHQQHIIFVIMLLAVLILPYHFSLAEETTTLTTAFSTSSSFEECTTTNVVDLTTIQTNNDDIHMIRSKQEQQPKANATNTINNETHIEGQVKIETEEHAINKENFANEITLVLNGDFADTRTISGNESTYEDQAVNAMPPHVEENYSENINQTSENADDVDNDIFSILEERPGNKKSSDFNNTHMETFASFTENLEESIRNSVKNEIEMEQHLEPSPVLEILKDIPEPEIREILKEDLRIDPKILDENTVKWRREKNRSFETESDHNRISQPQPAIKNILTQELSSQMEKESLKALENAREIRNPNLEQDHQRGQRVKQMNIRQNTAEFNLLDEVRKNRDADDDASSTEQSKNDDIKPYKEEIDEEVEGSGLKSDIYLEIAENSSEIRLDKTTHITDMVELEHLEAKKSSSEENDSLSVVLEESLTSSLPEPDEQQNLLNLEREEAASAAQQELEEATTLTTEQTEHIVIKKVLDMKDILEMQPQIAETTLPLEEKEENGNYANYSDEPNDLEFVTGKIKAQESVEKKSQEEEQEEQEEVQKNINEVEWGSGVGEDSYNKFASWPEEDDRINEKKLKNIDFTDRSQNNLEINSDNQSHLLSTEKLETHKSNETDDQIPIWPPTNDVLNSNEKEISEAEEITVIIPSEYDENEKEHQTLTETQSNLKSDEPENRSQDESSQLDEDNKKVNSLQDEHKRVEDVFNIKQEEDEKDKFWLSTTEYLSRHSTENALIISTHMAITPLGVDLFTHDIRSTTENSLDIEYSSRTAKGSRSINTAINQRTATLFETYPPRDAGQTFNNNLAAETSSGIGKALPVSINDGTSRSTVIIILSSGTAFLFIIVSVTIFLISFQRQHGTLDIEMQERNCGKDNLDEEDAETFTKLLEIELPSQVAVALEETEECL